MVNISVISPIYNAENIIPELIKRLSEELKHISSNYEIILVDDGSQDNSWLKICLYCNKDKRVKGIKLSRNFGQHYAVTAGLKLSQGACSVIIDCDLQDDPTNIGIMYKKFCDGYEIVLTRRITRDDHWLKVYSAKIYNYLFRFFSDSKAQINNSSLVLVSSKVRETFLKYSEYHRLYIQMICSLGFKSITISIHHQKRFEGKSSYSFIKLISLAINGWTSFSNKLLQLSLIFGFVFVFLTLIGIAYILARYMMDKIIPGWTSIIILNLFSLSLLLLILGIQGIYIGKIFEQTKNRPLFIIDKMINTEDDK